MESHILRNSTGSALLVKHSPCNIPVKWSEIRRMPQEFEVRMVEGGNMSIHSGGIGTTLLKVGTIGIKRCNGALMNNAGRVRIVNGIKIKGVGRGKQKGVTVKETTMQGSGELDGLGGTL